MPANMLLYGVAIRDAISRGNIDEMRAFASVSAALLRDAPDLDSADLAEWEAAQRELVQAVADGSKISINKDDVLVVKDGIVVIDNIELARALKPIVDSDLEPRLTITLSW